MSTKSNAFLKSMTSVPTIVSLVNASHPLVIQFYKCCLTTTALSKPRLDEIVFIKICHLMFVYMPFGLMVHVSQQFEFLVALALASGLFSTAGICFNKGMLSFRI